jgi:hypothetical protein
MMRWVFLMIAVAGCATSHPHHRAPPSWPRPPVRDHWDEIPPPLPPLPDPPKPTPPRPAEDSPSPLEVVPLTSVPTLAAACEAIRAQSDHAFMRGDDTFRTVKKGCAQRATKNPIRNGFLVEVSRAFVGLHGITEAIVVAPGFQRGGKILVALDAEVVNTGATSMRGEFVSGTIEVRERFLQALGPDADEGRLVVFMLTTVDVKIGPTRFIVCDEKGAWCTKPVEIDEGGELDDDFPSRRKPLESSAFKFERERESPSRIRVVDPTRARTFRLPEKMTSPSGQ